MTKIDILKACTVEGNIIKLPTEQMDRKLYIQVKNSLELIGGKWKGGKVYGFIFQTDPTDLLSEISNGGSINLKKEFQFFATPSKLAKEMVDYADISDGDSILEPSAGQGVILEHINNTCDTIPDCYELMSINRSILAKSSLKYNLIGSDFLESDNQCYDKIIANPPFSKNQDIDHVYRMYEKLNPGGTLVTIMSTHWQFSNNKKETQFKEWTYDVYAEVIELGSDVFKSSGTSTRTVLVIITKHDD